MCQSRSKKRAVSNDTARFCCLFQPDLLGVFFQQLPFQEGSFHALTVAVGLVALADDSDQVALLGVIHGVVERVQTVWDLHKLGIGVALVHAHPDIGEDVLDLLKAEAAAGGPIALVEEGDIIELDVEARRLEITGVKGEHKTPEEMDAILAERKANWKGFTSKYTHGLLKLYSQHAVSAMKGAYME